MDKILGKFRIKILDDSKVHISILLIFYFFIVFLNLGSNSFRDLDETIFVQASREIARTGDWITLHVRGKPFFHKQPFKIWLDGITFFLFGVSEFTARFWSAIFSFGTLLVVYFFAGKMYDKKTGFLSSLVLLFSSQFIFERCSRSAEEDAIFVFFSCCIFYLFWISRKKKLFIYFLSIFSGLAFMTKGIVVFLPVLSVVIFAIWAKEFNKLGIRIWLMSVLILNFIIFPWHILQFFISGKNFFKIYLAELIYFLNPSFLAGNNILTNFLTADVIQRIGYSGQVAPFVNSLYYAYVIAIGFFPWSIVLPFALVYLLKITLMNKHDIEPQEKKANFLLMCWLFLPLISLSLLYIKRTWRINLVYPVLAIIVAKFIRDIFKKRNDDILFFGMVFSLAVMIYLKSSQFGTPFYTFCPWLEYKLNFMLLNVSNAALFSRDKHIYSLLAFLFLIASFAGYRIFRNRDYIKNILALFFLGYLLFISSCAVFYLSSRSTYKSDMHIMSNKIHDFVSDKTMDLIVSDDGLFRMKYFDIKSEFPSMRDHWSDFYYLNNIKNVNLKFVKEDKISPLVEIYLNRDIPALYLLNKTVFDEVGHEKILGFKGKVIWVQGGFVLLYLN